MLSTINWAADLAAVTDAFAELACASDGAGELRFADLAGLAGGLARRLLAEGLRPGEPVATCLRNSLPTVWASAGVRLAGAAETPDRKSTRLNSSHGYISYAVFCLKKKTN